MRDGPRGGGGKRTRRPREPPPPLRRLPCAESFILPLCVCPLRPASLIALSGSPRPAASGCARRAPGSTTAPCISTSSSCRAGRRWSSRSFLLHTLQEDAPTHRDTDSTLASGFTTECAWHPKGTRCHAPRDQTSELCGLVTKLLRRKRTDCRRRTECSKWPMGRVASPPAGAAPALGPRGADLRLQAALRALAAARRGQRAAGHCPAPGRAAGPPDL